MAILAYGVLRGDRKHRTQKKTCSHVIKKGFFIKHGSFYNKRKYFIDYVKTHT